MGNQLIIKKVNPDNLKVEVTFLFERIEVPKRVAEENVVFIKPNIFSRDPSQTGATTDLDLLAAVIEYFSSLDKKVYVGEAGANQFAQTGMFEDLGLEKFCRDHGSEFLNLNEAPAAPIELEILDKTYVFQAPQLLLMPHFLVDIPKFKTHLSTRVSWAIKNLYGLLPDKEKWQGHEIGIHETLIALSHRFPAHAVLMDGIVAMKGLGPTMGIPDQKNLLFAADNQFVCDLGLFRLMRISHVPHIENCVSDKLMPIDYHFFDAQGLPVEYKTLGVDLRLPPLSFNRFFLKLNQKFWGLAPKLERFMNPKIFPNLLGSKGLVWLVRNVQKILKI